MSRILAPARPEQEALSLNGSEFTNRNDAN